MPNYKSSADIRPATRKKRKLRAVDVAKTMLMCEAALSAASLSHVDTESPFSSVDDVSMADPPPDERSQRIAEPSEQMPWSTPDHRDDFPGDDSSDDSYAPPDEEEDKVQDDDDDDDLRDIGFLTWDGDDSEDEEQRNESPDDMSAGRDSSHNGSTTSYKDTDDPPTITEQVDFSHLEVASLELMSLCDRSGARRGFYDDLLTLLRRFRKTKIDISRAKGRKAFITSLSAKVEAPKPRTSTVEGRKVVYFPFYDCLRDLLRSSIFDDPLERTILTSVSPLKPGHLKRPIYG